MAESNNIQLVFESVLEPDFLRERLNLSKEQRESDKYYRKCFKLIGENKRLKEQLADSDSLIEEIISSLNYGPDNELVRQAIDIYNQKWYGGR